MTLKKLPAVFFCRILPRVRYSKIVSLGAYRGERDVYNDELIGPINSSDEWIRRRTGIISRKRALSGTTVVDMAYAASKEALNDAQMRPEDIDLILVATITHFGHTPSVAAHVGFRIGVQDAILLDINAACAGFSYAIFQADLMIKSGVASRALVIGVDKLSEFIDPLDRTISFLLADGAGAAILVGSTSMGIGKTVCGGNPGQLESVGLTGSTTDVKSGSAWPTLRQEGSSIFRWAVWQMAKVAKQILDINQVQPGDLNAFIPHQANIRIIDELAKQIGLEEYVLIAQDICKTGNTSSASIPLAMHSLIKGNPSLSGELALQIGFGAGLVYAGQTVVMP
ncbi:beta-ketoacyl-ACP synthase III [Tropheryma whipplei]|uniref:beta-ketoacyl-ACP synthase III n=1 Tax=Tropheryma whipplei TaxID=2039 RepID=UPI0005A73B1D|nr:beta-ketoacyl-ACP synthase III [Tropheryma whipplei]